jgi:cyclic pyranopterin phosphate synthase
MPPAGLEWTRRAELLTADEIVRVAAVAVAAGVTKIRLTGGEPLVRPDCVDIVAGLAELTPRPQIALTTNAVLLQDLAQPLAAAGLNRVNLSLDSLDRETYARLTRRDRLPAALAGLAAAQRAGLAIKINAVLLPGINDTEAPQLLRFALEQGAEMRFIEHMPLGEAAPWQPDRFITAAEILDRLRADFELEPLGRPDAATAERWLVDGGPGVVGVIASMSRPFCGDCSRLRLTADGQLRHCLFATTETNLRAALRSGATAADLLGLMQTCLNDKSAGHQVGAADFQKPARGMSQIGG